MKKLYAYFLIVMIALFTVACTNKEDNEEKNIHPFTGIETTEDVSNRAIAVMVSNQVQARPQSGLTKADIVYEMLTEANITRFLAIYQSTMPELVGPVRSARDYFYTLANDLDAVYLYSGAANFINDDMDAKDIERLEAARFPADGNPFVRETFRKAPHNLYVNFANIYDAIEKKGYATEATYEPYPFIEEDTEIEGEEATYIKVDYYGSEPVVEYKYDKKTERYTRWNDGETTIELESEIPIEMDNVFIVEAEHEVVDEELRRDIDIHSGGKGYLFQKGKVQLVDWENRDGRILPVKDGEIIPFVPGQTWINFVETNPTSKVKAQVEYSNDN